ncbi:E3 ubiquitin-protein ligase TRIM33 isoform X2 [Pristis pectinata]|uniref:E3 ubiquitin-protein ligase TRIM33 isoform X2 n=1 Tax=Pristis pectinata TaxID=685728 RepID=UPI00223DD9B6|nr:E3 ubiquitin-protein ligase TRIM33 isoform X2 [Pristis pectinata]
MDQSGTDNIVNSRAENECKSNSAEDELNLFRTCLVCKKDLTNRQPRLLPCLHSFCKDCVPAEIRSLSPTITACPEDSNGEGIICCPACRQTCFTGDVVENVFIREYPLVSQTMDKHCSECEKKPAFKLCSDCSKWLCSACSEEHLHGKDTKHHKLLTPEHAAGSEGEVHEFSLLCPLHTKEPLKLFCETCDVLACWNCQLTQHKEHSFKYLEDVLQNQKVTLEELTLKMEEKKVSMQSSAKQVQDRLNEVMQVRMKVENQIKMAKMIMINELNKRVNVLMDQVERITNERRLKLEHQLQAVMGLCRHLEHVLNFINWAVSKKNNIPFLFSKELIMFQMRRLLETQCNTDLGPSKIHFHWDSVLWTKKLSSLGYLSFDSENSTHQECQTSFPQQQSPLPSDTADHRPCLPPSLLCQNPGQQYSVCGNRCPDPRPMQKDHETVNCLQNHQTLGQLAGNLQHQLQVQYSGMQQRQPQQKYFPRPFPVQPIPTLQPWHIAQTGPEQSTVLIGHLQAQRLQPSLHSAYTVPQQRSMTPMHVVALQQPKQLVHQPQQKQLFQLQHLKLPNQSSVQPYPVKQRLPPEQIQHQPPVENSQGKPPSKEPGQHSQPEQMPIAHKDSLEQSHPLSQKLQNMQTAQKTIMRQIVLKKQDIPVEPQHCGQQRVVNNQDQQGEKNQAPELNVVSQVTLHNPLDVEKQQNINGNRENSTPVQPPDLLRLPKAPEKQSTSSRSSTKRMCSSAPKKGRRKRSASGQIESTLPVNKESLHPAPLLIELHTPLTTPRSHGDSQGHLPENIPVNWEPKETKYKSEDTDTRVPKESMETEPDPFKENSCKEPMNLSVNAENPRINGSQDMATDSLDEGTPHDKTNQRAQMDGVKVPYVRLERLEICAPSTGQLPIFKVQSAVHEDESKHLVMMDSQTLNTATKSITLDSTLTPPNSNPPPPQQCETDDAAVTSDLPPDVAAFPSPSDDKTSEANSQTTPNAAGATDDNEDYCAVCLNGGELLCCDRCPKVFHLQCHVPSLLSFPMGEWLCTLCRNVVMPEVEYDCENTRHINENRGIRTLQGLSISDQRKCEKLTLHLYCYPLSLPFHEPVSPLARHYYQIIKRPMDLSTVRAKLQKKSPLHYYTPEEFISDIQLMFMNCAKFNYIRRWPKLEEVWKPTLMKNLNKFILTKTSQEQPKNILIMKRLIMTVVQ